MSYTLGLDIGSNSIGWAAIDVTNGVLHGMGVRVFPEGVSRSTSGAEESKNEKRREARGHRRQIQRRARRKQAIRTALHKVGWWTDSTDVMELMQQNPWELRAKALDTALTLAELGRVFLHLAQRRGFLSNRKADRGRTTENSEILANISSLDEAIQTAKARTLGEYLYWIDSGRITGTELNQRGWHTRRQMFLDEFDLIWKSQRRFHPDELTDEMRYGLDGPQQYPCEPSSLQRTRGNTAVDQFGFHGILFFQRPMYWSKSVIGRCDLEPSYRKCERADRRAQRFRLLNEVNNLRIIPQLGDVRPLTESERQTVIALLERRKDCDFNRLRGALELHENDLFNLEAGSRKKLDGMPIDHFLAHRRRFGRRWWDFSERIRNEIVRSLIDDETPEVIRKAQDDWGCSDGVAEELAECDPSAIVGGYSSLSIQALENLLPHLTDGLPLSAKDHEESALARAGYLRPDQRTVSEGQWLPLPSDKITNPLVKQAMFEVRKVVHEIFREWGIPAAIHIELAREIRGSAAKRAETAKANKRRESQRKDAADLIRERNQKPTRDAIQRVLLWREQQEICLYSGKPISLSQLLGGEVDIDHILPYSRSLDDSMMNKVVVFRRENQAKGNRTIGEWLREANPEKYEQVLQNARRLPREIRSRKVIKLKQHTVQLDHFIARQLTDTAYITTQVMGQFQHLRNVDVVPVKGQMTAELRHMWGLNSVLRTDELDLKNREDHRHHAIDALVVALTSRSAMQQLARVRGTAVPLSPPFAEFRTSVVAIVNSINVSHRATRDISGQLHEETLYGATQKVRENVSDERLVRGHARTWTEDDNVYVVRKNLQSLSLNEVENIRDERVREVVKRRLEQFGITAGRRERGSGSGSKIPPNVWEEPLYVTSRHSRSHRQPNPIRKVRVLKSDATIRPIRGGATNVKPGNTHHIEIYELRPDNQGRRRRVLYAVSMLKAAELAKSGSRLVVRNHPDFPDAQFIMSLSAGECIQATIRGVTSIFVFRTAASTQGQIYFALHTDARKSSDYRKFVVNANTLDGAKVSVTPAGKIRRSGD